MRMAGFTAASAVHGLGRGACYADVRVSDVQATAAAEAAAQSEQGRLAGPTLLPPASKPYVCLTDRCRVRATSATLMALVPQLKGPGVTRGSRTLLALFFICRSSD